MDDLTTRLDALGSSIESSLADISAAMADKEVATALGAIEQGLADLVARVGTTRIDLSPVVEALRALKPTIAAPLAASPVTVEFTAPPAPPAQIHMMPAASPAKWTITYPGQFGPKTMTIERS